ncbi:phage tail protein [Chelativorans sp.]|uniref:COG4223 family protein n=1 Tax=Chelativorans sp. TaxID=2203393 RepID=UPI00281214EA|nr:phage tail protein [Chelativorans sp.]
MVKTPRTRHSNMSREPVTIDLDAEPVRREDSAEGPASPAGDAARDPVPEPAPAYADAQADDPDRAAGGDSALSEAELSQRATSGAPYEAAEPTSPSAGEPGADGPGSIPEEPAQPASSWQGDARSRSGVGSALLAGVAGALIALAIGAALIWAEMVPVGREAAPDPAVGELQQQVAALQSELAQVRETGSAGTSAEALEQALAEPRQQIAELRDTVAALQSAPPGQAGPELQTLSQQLAELEQRVAATPQAAEAAGGGEAAQRIEELQGRVDSAVQAATAAQETAAATAQRLDEIVRQVTQLGEQVAQQDQQPQLALVVAASALRSAVERGAPFASELETYAALAPNAAELEPLRPYAQTGIPTEAELVSEAPQVASQIAATQSDVPPDAGFFERLMASARSAVTVRPVGEAEGDTPGAIAARMEAAVQRSDYAQALAEFESLPADAKQTAQDFGEKLRARQAADQVLEKALSGALKPA